MINNAFKNLLAISSETDYKVEALAKAQAAAASVVSAGPAKTESK